MNTQSKFERDLELWEKFEQFVIKVCSLKFGLTATKNIHKLWVDLIWDWYTLEVKYDTLFRKTWNFFIEYLYKWERSWILKYNATYFVYGDENEFWIFDRQDLWQLSLVWWKKIIWWDDNNSTWLLIKYDEIIDLALYNYKRYDNTKIQHS